MVWVCEVLFSFTGGGRPWSACGCTASSGSLQKLILLVQDDCWRASHPCNPFREMGEREERGKRAAGRGFFILVHGPCSPQGVCGFDYLIKVDFHCNGISFYTSRDILRSLHRLLQTARRGPGDKKDIPGFSIISVEIEWELHLGYTCLRGLLLCKIPRWDFMWFLKSMTWPFCLVTWLQHMAVGTGIQRASLIASSCLKWPCQSYRIAHREEWLYMSVFIASFPHSTLSEMFHGILWGVLWRCSPFLALWLKARYFVDSVFSSVKWG